MFNGGFARSVPSVPINVLLLAPLLERKMLAGILEATDCT
jgi:hypothetical protein